MHCRAVADGHRDPETGACRSISSAYNFEVRLAFVIDAAEAPALDKKEIP